MHQRTARTVALVGGGTAATGEHGVLVFQDADGEQFALALRFDQFPELVRTAALFCSEAQKRGGDVQPVSVEQWSTEGTPESAVLSLKVFGGLELRFQIPRGTKDPSSERREEGRH